MKRFRRAKRMGEMGASPFSASPLNFDPSPQSLNPPSLLNSRIRPPSSIPESAKNIGSEERRAKIAEFFHLSYLFSC